MRNRRAVRNPTRRAAGITDLVDAYHRAMAESQSRLQLLDDLGRLTREHTAAARGLAATPASACDDLFERYSYAELQVIADFLSADIQRLLDAGP